VKLLLQTADVPSWFCTGLEFQPGALIAIVDDDQSIHSVWEERFRGLEVKLHHFANPHQLMGAHKAGNRFDRYLVDYEFLGQSQNGLELIEREKIEDRAILVTSRHNELDVRTRAQRLQVAMIPKALAALVPIQVQQQAVSASATKTTTLKPSPMVILLDDDDLIHMMWGAAARNSGIELKAFKRSSDLEKWLSENPAIGSLKFYVDVELGEGEPSGIEVARQIASSNRGPVYLATGHDPAEFKKHTFLKGVVGKAPPKDHWRS
jgi:DNA-binding NtrC family response regulator